MSALALTLVLTAAVLHATWNLSAKRAAGGNSVAFVLLMSMASAAFALPFGLAVWVADPPALGALEWVTIVAVVGVLSPVAYVLVLFALRLAPLAYVAPLREVSMMIGVFYGAWLLRERVTAVRVGGVACMIAGVAALAFA